MSGEANTLYDAYRSIEEVMGTYGEKRLAELVKSRSLTNEELHEARGKVQATEELLKIVRNTLGYDHTAL